jgi:hypothetical protein
MPTDKSFTEISDPEAANLETPEVGALGKFGTPEVGALGKFGTPEAGA